MNPDMGGIGMEREAARSWIIKVSLGLTGGVFIFLVLSPFLGYPLDPGAGDLIRLLEILFPVFLGYLGMATHFVFRSEGTAKAGAAEEPPLSSNAVLLIRGPVLVWMAMIVAAFTAFGLANRAGAPAGTGMSVDLLAGLVTAALGLLAATTSVAVSYLFSGGEKGGGEAVAG